MVRCCLGNHRCCASTPVFVPRDKNVLHSAPSHGSRNRLISGGHPLPPVSYRGRRSCSCRRQPLAEPESHSGEGVGRLAPGGGGGASGSRDAIAATAAAAATAASVHAAVSAIIARDRRAVQVTCTSLSGCCRRFGRGLAATPDFTAFPGDCKDAPVLDVESLYNVRLAAFLR